MAENKIAVIGDKDIVFGFKAFGLEVFPISSKDEGKKVIEKVKDYAIVFITEDWIEKLEEDLLPLKEATIPAVISIPTHLGSTGYGLKELKKIVERAVGSDILFKNR